MGGRLALRRRSCSRSHTIWSRRRSRSSSSVGPGARTFSMASVSCLSLVSRRVIVAPSCRRRALEVLGRRRRPSYCWARLELQGAARRFLRAGWIELEARVGAAAELAAAAAVAGAGVAPCRRRDPSRAPCSPRFRSASTQRGRCPVRAGLQYDAVLV